MHYNYHATETLSGDGERQVLFYWGPRHNAGETPDTADKPTNFRSGFQIQTDRRLVKIDSMIGTRLLTAYEFSYANKPTAADPQGSPQSQLLSVKRYDTDGPTGEFFTTHFDYETTAAGFSSTPIYVDMPTDSNGFTFGAGAMNYNRDIRMSYGANYFANCSATDPRLTDASLPGECAQQADSASTRQRADHGYERRWCFGPSCHARVA